MIDGIRRMAPAVAGVGPSPRASGPSEAPPEEDVETERRSPPASALGISVLSLAAAAVVGVAWPESVVDYSGFVWILALVPLFLLSYYRGWEGAALASAMAMLALVLVELVLVRVQGHSVDWWVLGSVTGPLILVTLGAGWLSELLLRQRSLAIRLAYRDPLTGLANRRLLREHAETAMARADREEDVRVGVIFLDLIRFKRLNDDLGHHAGDEALSEIASRLQSTMRDADTVARVGGDEFAVLVAGELTVQDVVSVARRLQERISLPFVLGGETVRQRARLGVAMYPQHAGTFDELLSHADPGKHRGGNASRDEIVVCSSVGSSEPDEVAMEKGLRRAVHRGPAGDGDELEVHYHPVVSLSDDAVAGAEALVRWDHPDSGLLEAAKFISVAEYTGLVQTIEERVLEDAVRWAAEWSDADGPDWVSVNLSPASYEGPEVVDQIRELLEAYDLPARHLVVELTEQADLRHPEAVAAVVDALRDTGVRLAIDDFGSGHASLSYLEQFPAHFLKVDPTYVSELGRGARGEQLVEGVIGLGRGLGLELIAEGVEKWQQYEWLKEHGVDYYQGHLRGKPVPPEQLSRRMDRESARGAVG